MSIKVIFFLLLVHGFVSYVELGKTHRELAEIPKDLAQKEGCYIKEINDVIPFYSAATTVGVCVKINCSEDILTIEQCDEVGTDDPKCFITDIDYSRPYPKCCPTLECDLEVSQI